MSHFCKYTKKREGISVKRGKIGTVQEALLRSYGLEPGRLERVEALTYEKGEYISRERMPLSRLLLLESGKAKAFCDVENGRRLLVCFYESVGVIGEMELMMEMEGASASVACISKCAGIGIGLCPGNIQYMRSNAVFLNIVAKSLAYKLERSSKNGAHIILYPLEERLCSYIEVTNENGVFEEKLTEVAEVIGTSYRHLLRELSHLTALGILEKCGRKYYIRNAEELAVRSRDFYRPVETRRFH